jgi:hypothetical protein
LDDKSEQHGDDGCGPYGLGPSLMSCPRQSKTDRQTRNGNGYEQVVALVNQPSPDSGH